MKFAITLFFSFIIGPIFSQVEADISVFNKQDSLANENEFYTDLTDKLIVKFTKIYQRTHHIVNSYSDKTFRIHMVTIV